MVRFRFAGRKKKKLISENGPLKILMSPGLTAPCKHKKLSQVSTMSGRYLLRN